MNIVLPNETDYPDELFNVGGLSEYRVACPLHYYRINRAARYFYWRRVETAFELLPRQQWERVLDIGTGAGVFLPGLSSGAHEVVGADVSRVLYHTQAMLDKRGICNAYLHFADALHLPFTPNTFDLIMCMSIIEHIPDPAAALTEMGRVLSNDGVLIVGYPLEHSFFRFVRWLGIRLPRRLMRRLVKGQAKRADEPFHPHVSSYRSIDRSCERAFRVDARRNVGFMGIPLYRVLRLVNRKSGRNAHANGTT